MNTINLNNIKRITATTHNVVVRSNEKYSDVNESIVVLSESDITNDNKYIKLRGLKISVLLVPIKYKYTLYDTELGKLIRSSGFDGVVSYY